MAERNFIKPRCSSRYSLHRTASLKNQETRGSFVSALFGVFLFLVATINVLTDNDVVFSAIKILYYVFWRIGPASPTIQAFQWQAIVPSASVRLLLCSVRPSLIFRGADGVKPRAPLELGPLSPMVYHVRARAFTLVV